MISLTGNYTFLNFLTIVLCIPLLDDQCIEALNPFRSRFKLKEIVFNPQRLHSADQQSDDSRSETAPQEVAAGAGRGPAIPGSRLILIPVQIAMFGLAFTQFISGLGGSVPVLSLLPLEYLAPFRLFNSYGMFAVMTTTRPEIVYEGSLDGKEWRPYEFKYKVGDLNKAPPVVAPHMPRLDWRLWFAAMVPAHENPYVYAIARLLLKGEPLMLTAFKSDPFHGGKPRYIRAWVYDYHFSDWNELFSKGQWWRRDNKRLFIPPLKLSPEGDLIPAAAEQLPSDQAQERQ